jgi:hypothetical protein
MLKFGLLDSLDSPSYFGAAGSSVGSSVRRGIVSLEAEVGR